MKIVNGEFTLAQRMKIVNGVFDAFELLISKFQKDCTEDRLGEFFIYHNKISDEVRQYDELFNNDRELHDLIMKYFNDLFEPEMRNIIERFKENGVDLLSLANTETYATK